MKPFQNSALVALLIIAMAPALSSLAQDDCTKNELRSFDFLVGDWLTKDGKGGMSIERILEGCGLREDWQLEGFNAVLLRTYDSKTSTWYLSFAAHDLVPQVWEGKFEDGNWIFYRDWKLNGKNRRSRTFWKNLPGGGFEKIVEQLSDDKKTWRLHDKAVFIKSNSRTNKNSKNAKNTCLCGQPAK